ncbi:MAG: dimethyl sulfoxide reductase anchor subunit [Pelagimonas sp.]|jgi:DMSO reductase anchor subunit|nr:dimethyl sulfoxide reductase anchor subunit [Pelagimonas sp.]
MHPAPSVIIFTSLSGLGFGLLFWLGIDASAPTGWIGFTFFLMAYALAVGGLLASTFHLGRRERAIKAFRQWRSSWLSREGWAAVLTLLVMGLYAALLVFGGLQLHVLGWLGAVLALATVFTTSMIYTQLRSVPRWHHWSTPALFLVLMLGGGALLSGRVTIAIALLILAGLLQAWIWYDGDSRLLRSGSDMQSATGLGQIGKVRAFEPPHTGTNYLLREMVHVVGRKHSRKIRVIGLALMSVLPAILLLLPFGHFWAALAVVSHIAGVFTCRWLFFAEAEHVVGLYYGKR